MGKFRTTTVAAALSLSVLVSGGTAFGQSDVYVKIESDMQAVRELELKHPLQIETQTRAQLREDMLAEIQNSSNTDTQAENVRVLVILGFVEPGADVAAIQSNLLGDQVLGYYDPQTGQMVVVSDAGEPTANDQVTFAHETVHALQDQNFDLMAYQQSDQIITDDFNLTRGAVIEGDATVAQVLWMQDNPEIMDAAISEQEGMDSSALDEAPLFMKDMLYFPYDQGATFIVQIYRDGGWDAVNALYTTNPPTTTEQILHPEKYYDGEGAVPVRINDPTSALGTDWRVLDFNQTGEYVMDIHLRNGGATNRTAARATEGWGGDWYYIVGNENETAMVWSSAWDSEDDAVEYMDALVQTEMERLDGKQVDTGFADADASVRFETADGQVGEIHRTGDVVTYFLGDSQETVATLVESQANADYPDTSATPEASPEAPPVATPPAPRAVFWLREQ